MEFIDLLSQMGIALLFTEGLMCLFWVIYLFNNQIKIVDIAWGLSFPIMTTLYFIMGEGYIWRKILILSLVIIWSFRLVSHLIERFDFEKDDPRYLRLLDSQRNNFFGKIKIYSFRVLVLFLLQGLLVTILSLPFTLMNNNDFFYFYASEILGLLVWVVGILNLSIADQQLSTFKMNPANQNRVCEEGWWRYSRHPNYFYEWVVWIGYSVMAICAPLGWLGIISPLLILYLLLKVSGVPMSEEQALLTRGEAYRTYQKTTSVFFPWLPRSGS